MTLARLSAWLGFGAAAACSVRAYELNRWPAYVVQQAPEGVTRSWDAAGPLAFSEPVPAPDPGTAEGLRPFYVRVTGGGVVRTDILYPLFFFRRYPGAYKWSILQLINGEGLDHRVARAGGPRDRHFDLWPFYFSHVTEDPVDTYHALLPIYGTIKYRLGYSKLQWVLFPLYAETRRRHTTTNYFVFPIFRNLHGDENGFAVWPLFNVSKGPDHTHRTSFLWPLIWNNELEPDPSEAETAPHHVETGFLPFYMKTTKDRSVEANYLIFTGYTDRTFPGRYHETRYCWPFFVQGRGDQHYVNRWGPFWTHSNIRGTDNRWILWPLWHEYAFADDDVVQTKTQFLYFLWYQLDERSGSRPGRPHAYKRHVWPFFSAWSNGAGSRQVQALSPLEVFFPGNADLREAWSPLFALYRYDHQPTGETRQSVLWNAVTWRRNPREGLVEFHVGPLLGRVGSPAGSRWTILGFDFGARPGQVRPGNR